MHVMGMVISPAEKALSHMARYFIYSGQVVSQRTFEDEEFREMCQSMYTAG